MNHPKTGSYKSLAEVYDATISASTAVNVNASANRVMISAFAKGVLVKWDGTVSTSDFDFAVSQDTTVVVEIPANATTINIIEQAATAAVAVAQYP